VTAKQPRPQNPSPAVRLNRQIRADEVRLIGPDGKQIGIVPLAEALKVAADAELDLVEISPDATPPVCKVLNWSKEQYLKDKEQRAAKRRQQADHEVKEIQLRPGISDHDLQVRAQSTKRFLDKGAKVRVVVRLHGRLAGRPELVDVVLERLLELVSPDDPAAYLDGPASRSGNRITQMLRLRS